MQKQYEYLTNPSFLKVIDNLQAKEQFVKITVLDWVTENPIEDIQGKISAGSCNVNGSSAVRRTCSLTMLADDSNYDILNVKNIIAINKKIRVEVGFTNTTSYYQTYKKIWFPLGVFIIKNASISHNNSSINISLTLNDKMAMLNGDCGGIIPAVTTLSEIDVLDEMGQVVDKEVPLIFDIIKNLVHEFGGEQLGRIIINDVPLTVNNIIRWSGDQPLLVGNDNGRYVFGTKENDMYQRCSKKSKFNENIQYFTFDDDTQSFVEVEGLTADTFNINPLQYFYFVNYITKTYGQNIGYQETPFIYPGSKPLTASPGEAVTTVLDKIKNCLGNFEYYYDVFGNFIFQEIKNYLNNSQATHATRGGIDPTGYLINRSRASSVYQFPDGHLLTSYSNNPQFNNIKNDYIVWGSRTSGSGATIPIRYHLAIDQKPTIGNYYIVKVGMTSSGVKTYNKVNLVFVDHFNDFFDNKVPLDSTYYYYCRKGENNLQKGFFVYDKDANIIKKLSVPMNPIRIIKTTDWRSELFMRGLFNTDNNAKINYYYRELAMEWPKIYDMAAEPAVKRYGPNGEPYEFELYEGIEVYQGKFIGDYYNLDYYLDFIDTDAALGQFSVDTIGRRTKVVNDKNVNCIFASDVLDEGIHLIEGGKPDTDIKEYEFKQKGIKYGVVPSKIYEHMATDIVQNSAYEKIRSLLYQNTSYNESVSISAIPIFYLEPNTRINIYNKKASIQGDYVIKSISLPLAVNGTMSISCTKALEQI